MKLLEGKIPRLLAVIDVLGSLLWVIAPGLSVTPANAQVNEKKGVGQHYMRDEVVVKFMSPYLCDWRLPNYLQGEAEIYGVEA